MAVSMVPVVLVFVGVGRVGWPGGAQRTVPGSLRSPSRLKQEPDPPSDVDSAGARGSAGAADSATFASADAPTPRATTASEMRKLARMVGRRSSPTGRQCQTDWHLNSRTRARGLK